LKEVKWLEYQTCGIILSGGQSRRFGGPKAFARFNEIPFWEHSLNALKEVTDTQIIVSHPSLLDRFKETTNLPIILDDKRVRGNGPMAGLFSAMEHMKAEWYVVLSCDIPSINEEVIAMLLTYRKQPIEAIIPVIDGRVQPLVGIYHSSLYQRMKEQLFSGNYRVMSLLGNVNTLFLSEVDLKIDPQVFRNINDHEAFNQLKSDK
jgi:molybdopterin-guanine dinucleotide biosynthesis protein A